MRVARLVRLNFILSSRRDCSRVPALQASYYRGDGIAQSYPAVAGLTHDLPPVPISDADQSGAEAVTDVRQSSPNLLQTIRGMHVR